MIVDQRQPNGRRRCRCPSRARSIALRFHDIRRPAPRNPARSLANSELRSRTLRSTRLITAADESIRIREPLAGPGGSKSRSAVPDVGLKSPDCSRRVPKPVLVGAVTGGPPRSVHFVRAGGKPQGAGRWCRMPFQLHAASSACDGHSACIYNPGYRKPGVCRPLFRTH